MAEREVMRFRAGNDLIEFIDDFKEKKGILDRSKTIRHLLNFAKEKIDKEEHFQKQAEELY